MSSAPFRLVAAVLDELGQAQTQTSSHSVLPVATVMAPGNALKIKAVATLATPDKQTVPTDIGECDSPARGPDQTEEDRGRARYLPKYVASVATVASVQENCGFGSSHIKQTCGYCGYSIPGKSCDTVPDGTRTAEPFDRVISWDALAATIPQDWLVGIRLVLQQAPPAGISRPEWRGLVCGATRLIADWGQQFAMLGWTTADLFALHRSKPMERYDYAGLVRFVGRSTIVAVTDASATLRCRTGALMTFVRRSPPTPDWVPIWELPGGN